MSQLHTIRRHRMAWILMARSNSLPSNDSSRLFPNSLQRAGPVCPVCLSPPAAQQPERLGGCSSPALEESSRSHSAPPRLVPDRRSRTETSHCDGRASDQMPSVLEADASFDKHDDLLIYGLELVARGSHPQQCREGPDKLWKPTEPGQPELLASSCKVVLSHLIHSHQELV